MRLKYLVACVLCWSPACFADFDPRNMDKATDPGVDFYQYSNGTWMKNATIPADHSTLGAFDIVEENNERILHGVAEKAAADPKPSGVQKIVGDFYFSGMDVAAVNAAGVIPLKVDFEQINSMRSTADLARETAKLQRLGAGVCFGFASEQDPKNSDMMIAGVGQGGLGLPDRDYYLRGDDESKKLREKYTAHVVKMLELAGDGPGAVNEAAAVMRIETALAKGSKSAEDLRDPVSNYHLTALADVGRLMPHFDWNAYLEQIGLAAPTSMDLGQPDFLKAFDDLIVATPLADWKAYLRWQLIHADAPFLSAAFVEENFSFFGTALVGTPKLRERWRRVISTIDGTVGDALGQLYVAEVFPPESKAKALEMVANIRRALRERIQNIDWMDEPTRQAALRKLDAYGVKVGYPDKWIDYGTLGIDRGSYVLNVERAADFLVRRDMAKIGRPVDRSEWFMTPPTVNAYYSPQTNEIVFTAGILQPPYFDPTVDDALNYGAIGSTMGHEMTHGFDDSGRQFDPKGNLADWWTPESAKRFKERSKAIVRQFSGYVAVDALHVNGELTQGENIADLGGLKLAYAALMKTFAGKPEVKIDGFSPEQRFFLSFASTNREIDRPEYVKLLVQTDPHAPNRLRVNGPVSNLDEFARAFGVPEGSPMRRAAADQVNIW